jgi:hypothetical protein
MRSARSNHEAACVSKRWRYPWWGYKRLVIVMRRSGIVVSKKFVYAVFKAEDSTQKRRATKAELYPSAKLFEWLPTRPNAL